jgi:MazG family protein
MSGQRFERLVELMARLRAPGGCPWDREQTFETLRKYLLEETYEVLDAIDREDWAHLAEELGDLQLQIVFQSQIAAEEGKFAIDDVLGHIADKLVRRHPHVFGEESIGTAGGVVHRWEEIKAEENRRKAADRGEGDAPASIFEGVPRSQPALLEADQLGKRAARVGFEWERFSEMLEKMREEIAELEQARANGSSEEIEDEIGDLLFMAVNFSRFLKINPELALRKANAKFRKRFEFIERGLRERGQAPEDATLDEMEELWQQAKR